MEKIDGYHVRMVVGYDMTSSSGRAAMELSANKVIAEELNDGYHLFKMCADADSDDNFLSAYLCLAFRHSTDEHKASLGDKIGGLDVSFIPLKGTSVPRNEIRTFAEGMEKMMKFHDDEKGDSWKRSPIVFLENCLSEELKEYQLSGEVSELFDIANFCMMLHHHKTKGDIT